jgi:hypothetical protein
MARDLAIPAPRSETPSKQLVARRSPGVSMFLYPSGHLAVATTPVLTLILVVRNSGRDRASG